MHIYLSLRMKVRIKNIISYEAVKITKRTNVCTNGSNIFFISCPKISTCLISLYYVLVRVVRSTHFLRILTPRLK